MLTQHFMIMFFGNLWLAYGNSNSQEAQDEVDFVRCPGHFWFSSWSFTKSAGFIRLLWPILSQNFVWVLRTRTINCRVIFKDFRIVPFTHTNTEILQHWYSRTSPYGHLSNTDSSLGLLTKGDNLHTNRLAPVCDQWVSDCISPGFVN